MVELYYFTSMKGDLKMQKGVLKGQLEHNEKNDLTLAIHDLREKQDNKKLLLFLSYLILVPIWLPLEEGISLKE